MVVVALAAAAAVEVVLRDLAPRWVLLPAVLLYTLPLMLRDRWPFAAPAFVIFVQVLSSFLDVSGGERENFGVAAYVLAIWVFGANNPVGRAAAGLGLSLAGIVIVTLEDVRVVAEDSRSVAIVGTLTWLAAVVLRHRGLRAEAAEERSRALERERREDQAALENERARIARELHDVVAHSVSVMTVQAGAARMLIATDPGRAVAPLLAVEETGRQALAEMRRMLGILRADDGDTALEPQPGLGNIPDLVEKVEDAGLSVQLEFDVTARPVAPGLGLAAYRIVQEALTNTLRHSSAREARVVVAFDGPDLRVEVHDGWARTSGDAQAPATDNARAPASENGLGTDKAGAPAASPEAGSSAAGSSAAGSWAAAATRGHGVAGMRERAALYGGTLEAGPDASGGYSVRAMFPIEGASQ